jgi:hypothetical protein
MAFYGGVSLRFRVSLNSEIQLERCKLGLMDCCLYGTPEQRILGSPPHIAIPSYLVNVRIPINCAMVLK